VLIGWIRQIGLTMLVYLAALTTASWALSSVAVLFSQRAQAIDHQFALSDERRSSRRFVRSWTGSRSQSSSRPHLILREKHNTTPVSHGQFSTSLRWQHPMMAQHK
jgi:hypothetical protein